MSEQPSAVYPRADKTAELVENYHPYEVLIAAEIVRRKCGDAYTFSDEELALFASAPRFKRVEIGPKNA